MQIIDTFTNRDYIIYTVPTGLLMMHFVLKWHTPSFIVCDISFSCKSWTLKRFFCKRVFRSKMGVLTFLRWSKEGGCQMHLPNSAKLWGCFRKNGVFITQAGAAYISLARIVEV